MGLQCGLREGHVVFQEFEALEGMKLSREPSSVTIAYPSHLDDAGKGDDGKSRAPGDIPQHYWGLHFRAGSVLSGSW